MSKTTRVCEMAYLDPEQFARLKALAEKTRIPRAALVREAIDLLLEHHAWLAKGGHGRHAPPYSRRAARKARQLLAAAAPPIDVAAEARKAIEAIEAFDRLPRRPESDATKACREERLARLRLLAATAPPVDVVAEKTRVPRAALIREAVDDLLLKHKAPRRK